MAKPDDTSLPAGVQTAVQAHAERLLLLADAKGCLPTPVNRLIEAAKLHVDEQVSLDDGFLTKLLRGAKHNVKRVVSAVRKLVGLFDARDGAIYLDQTIHSSKKPFATLHEAGHGFLPWQRSAFLVCEDDEKSLDLSIKDQFEREANVFASEVLFQCDLFSNEAEARPFGIRTPMKLAKDFGGSIYASIRRYVTMNSRACAVLVYDSEPVLSGDGRFYLELRRQGMSKRMCEEFGSMKWWERIYLDTALGQLVPQGKRRMVQPTQIQLTDSNGQPQVCLAEAFKTPYQTFVLICSQSSLENSQLSLARF